MSKNLELSSLRGACKEQRAEFRQRFGGSVFVTEELCQSVAQVFDWDWAAKHLLTAPARADYARATDAGWADYERSRAAAWADFARARAAAWADCERARTAIWAAIWADYERSRAATWADYAHARAAAFARCYINS